MFKIIFVLLLAGAEIGQVGSHDAPMTQAACTRIISDPDNIEFVHDAVLEATGTDVEVQGKCVPV